MNRVMPMMVVSIEYDDHLARPFESNQARFSFSESDSTVSRCGLGKVVIRADDAGKPREAEEIPGFPLTPNPTGAL